MGSEHFTSECNLGPVQLTSRAICIKGPGTINQGNDVKVSGNSTFDHLLNPGIFSGNLIKLSYNSMNKNHNLFNFLQPLSSSKTILVTPDTVKYYASFIHSSATVNDLTIQFSIGSRYEELLRVPIAAPGELTPQSLIRITVGMNPPTSTDNDPTVGISDGVNRNQFQLLETTISSTIVNPCDIFNGVQNGQSGPTGNPVAGGYTLLFDPIHRFGSCMTNNGFATDGRFNSQIDVSKGLNLVVHRDNANEPYVFHYFLIEFL